MTASVATIAREAVAWPDGSAHQAVQGTLVFADLSGFTALSERLAALGREGAEAMADQIDGVFGALLRGPAAGRGDLVKFGGDAVALLFTGDDHVRTAVLAADELRATLRRVGRRDTAGGQVTIRISIGVHTGAVDLFRVGADAHDLVVAGPAVSTVLAMEGTASAGQVLLSPPTAAAVPERWLADPLAPGVLLRRLPVGPSGHGSLGTGAPVLAAVAPSAWLPPVVAAELEQGGGDLEHRLVTVAFLQVVGLDDRLATGGPAVAAADLAATMAVVEDACRAYDVTFITSDVSPDGCKVVLLTGAPRSGGDDEDRALRAARAIVRGGAPLPVRIGLHRGAAFVGLLQLGDHARYTAMGDTVNTAARVMGKALPGQVLATPDVLDRSRTLFATTPIEPFVAKGKAKPIEAAAIGAITGLRPPATERLPLVGREAELTALHEAWAGARQGRGGTVLLTSEAGFGASRLLVELGSQVQADGGDLIRLRGDPYQTSSAHLLSGLLLRRVLGDDAVVDGAALVTALRRLDSALVPWAPLVGAVLGIAVEPTPSVEALAEQFRRRRQTEVVAATVLRALAAHAQPAAICVDDAHHADLPSLEVLDELGALAADGAPLLVAVSDRPAPAGEAARWRSTCVVRLDRLDDDGSMTLARLARGEAGIVPSEASEIARRASGNPALVVELARAPRDAPFPESIEAAVSARIDRLAPAGRALLRTCSVLGTSFSPSLVAAMAERSGGSGDLEALAEFLVPVPPGRLAFARPVEREAAYLGLSFARRRQLHRLAAEAIEADAHDDEPPDRRSASLATHRSAAGDWEEAARQARLAAEHAERAWQPLMAATFWRLAGDALASTGLRGDAVAEPLCRAGVQLLTAGSTDDALRLAQRARRLAGSGELRAQAARLLADLHERLGRPDRSHRAAKDGLAALDPDATGTTALMLHGSLVVSALLRGRMAAADRALERFEALAAAMQDLPSLARAAALRQTAVNLRGGADDRNARRAIDLYRQIGNRFGEGVMQTNLGNARNNAARAIEALDAYRAGATALRAAGAEAAAAVALSNVGMILLEQGRYDEAVGALESAASSTTATLATTATTTRCLLATALLRRGDLEAADAQVAPLDQSDPAVLLVQAELVLTRRGSLDGHLLEAMADGPATAWLEAVHHQRTGDRERASAAAGRTAALDGGWWFEALVARAVVEPPDRTLEAELERLGIIGLPPLVVSSRAAGVRT